MAQSLFFHRTTGAAVLAVAFQPVDAAGNGIPWTVHQVFVHLDIVGGAVEDLTMMIDGGVVAAVYDTLLLTQAMAAVTDIVWTPDAPMHMDATDVLDIDYNNGNTRTYGVTIVFTTRA